MRTMMEYIENASRLLEVMWDETNSNEVANYLTKHLDEWSSEEQQDLLVLCALLASHETQFIEGMLWAAQKVGHAKQRRARTIGARLLERALRDMDYGKSEQRRKMIQRHFSIVDHWEYQIDDYGETKLG